MDKGKTSWLGLAREYNTYLVLLLLLVAACALSKDFRTYQNISNLLSQASIVGVIAIGQTMVLLTGGFDLAHGSFIALLSVLFAVMQPMGTAPAICLAFLILALLGAANGFLINRGVNPFIMTLGMMGIARSLAMFLSNANAVNLRDQSVKYIAYETILGVPVSVVIWLVLVLVCNYILRHTRIGLHVYAYGGNRESARLSGVNIRSVVYFVYIASALLAAVSGLIYVAKLGVALPDKAVGYELDSIAASVIGGTSLVGGIGSMPKTLVGVLIYGMITNLLNILGVSSYWQDVTKGLIILMAMYLNSQNYAKKRGQ